MMCNVILLYILVVRILGRYLLDINNIAMYILRARYVDKLVMCVHPLRPPVNDDRLTGRPTVILVSARHLTASHFTKSVSGYSLLTSGFTDKGENNPNIAHVRNHVYL